VGEIVCGIYPRCRVSVGKAPFKVVGRGNYLARVRDIGNGQKVCEGTLAVDCEELGVFIVGVACGGVSVDDYAGNALKPADIKLQLELVRTVSALVGAEYLVGYLSVTLGRGVCAYLIKLLFAEEIIKQGPIVYVCARVDI